MYRVEWLSKGKRRVVTFATPREMENYVRRLSYVKGVQIISKAKIG